MPWLGAVLLTIGFLAIIHLFRLIERAKSVTQEAQAALLVVRDQNATDDEKEVRLQKHAISLFKLFFVLTIGGTLAVAVPLGLLWVMEQCGWLSLDKVLAAVISVEFIVGSCVVGILLMIVVKKFSRNV